MGTSDHDSRSSVTLYKKLPYDPATDFAPSRWSPACRSCWWSIRRCRCTRSPTSSSSPRRSPASSLRLERRRRVRRIFSPSCSRHDRHQDDAHPLQGHRAGASTTWSPATCRSDVLRFRARAAAGQAGKLRALGVSSATRVRRRCPKFRRSPKPACPASTPSPGRCWSRRRDAEADRRQAACASSRRSWRRPTCSNELVDLGIIPIDSPSPEELQRFVKSEIVAGAKVVEQAGARGIAMTDACSQGTCRGDDA